MYADEALTDEADLTVDLDTDDLMLTSLDPEFHHLISDPTLSAELAALRQPRPEPTTALLDGSARARRDRRVARRAMGNAVRVLHTESSVTTDGEAA
ncbi:hypothetical protein JOF56_010999 [Kibdelosporangium banguiense]|uniref:Uncharacterized protein n=1 Tax=Kibdelosporangium banguiense TaxID=1365924 RepID=A0ABS4U1S9_9PSEU|nr:hypothetical protein [Kibdelosporangium banguiense]MBP2330614.1 hypothetical protein [Kibdelosporangium banguiense]